MVNMVQLVHMVQMGHVMLQSTSRAINTYSAAGTYMIATPDRYTWPHTEDQSGTHKSSTIAS